MRILAHTFFNTFTYLINPLYVTMLFRPQSLFGTLLTPKFSLLGSLPSAPPLELPRPAPGPLPACVPSLPTWALMLCTRLPPPPCVYTPLTPAWTLVPHPGIPLFPAGCPSHPSWLREPSSSCCAQTSLCGPLSLRCPW